MTVSELKKILENMPETAQIRVLVEMDSRYEGDNIVPRCQYDFPANDVAFSKRTNSVIVMTECFNEERE